MFPIPTWEEDVPKTDIDLVKNPKHKKNGFELNNNLQKHPKVENAPNDYSFPTSKISSKKRPQNKRKKIKQNKDLNSLKKSDILPEQNTEVSLISNKVSHVVSKKEHNQFDSMKIPAKKVISMPVKAIKMNKDKKPKVSKKRKLTASEQKEPTDLKTLADVPQLDTDRPDEVLINVKKKRFNDAIKGDDIEGVLFKEATKCPTLYEKRPINFSKKQKIRKILESQTNRKHITVTGNNLRQRMLEKLKAAQFRYLNEKLYTSSGSEAQILFQTDPQAFQTYHEGYQQQLKKWPVNPLDVIVKRILKMPKTSNIVDMGCGEAALSRRLPHTVRSFDLVASVPGVEVCDMARTPLLSESIDVAVYCLALMGTDLTQFLVEANRVLKMGGLLLIAEVESRFDNVEGFSQDIQKLGFKLIKLDKSNSVFYFMEFKKIREAPAKKSKLPALSLKPCLYKRR